MMYSPLSFSSSPSLRTCICSNRPRYTGHLLHSLYTHGSLRERTYPPYKEWRWSYHHRSSPPGTANTIDGRWGLTHH